MVVMGRLLGAGQTGVRGIRRDAGEIRFYESGSVSVEGAGSASARSRVAGVFRQSGRCDDDLPVAFQPGEEGLPSAILRTVSAASLPRYRGSHVSAQSGCGYLGRSV
jgi:hypothetical protein